jgi:hypothetical protein
MQPERMEKRLGNGFYERRLVLAKPRLTPTSSSASATSAPSR